MRIHRFFVTGAAIIVITVVGVARALAPVGAQGGERPLTYTIQPGETLYRIARQFGLPLDDLMAANNITNPNLIRVGQDLIIPQNAARPSNTAGMALAQPSAPAGDLGILGPDGQRLDNGDSPPPILSDPRDTVQPDLGILGAGAAGSAPPVPAAVSVADLPAESAPPAETLPESAAPELDNIQAPSGAPESDSAQAAADPRAVTDPSVIAPDLGILAPEAAPWLVSGNIISTGGPVVRATYELGQQLGNNPHAFSKIGDCNSEPPFFLVPFDEGAYDLGPYGYLQPVIDYFAGSFARTSATVWTGNHAWAVFDPTWANPAMCLPGEAPIECEFRINRPSIVLIRLGTNEAYTPDLFETNLRKIIEFSLERGAIPVLGTKADRLEGSDAINELIRALADEYKIPLWDFGRAADNLPGRGLRPDGFHMTFGAPYYGDPAALQSGHAVHNLTALMALGAVWRSATE